jgi:hypothetical protein
MAASSQLSLSLTKELIDAAIVLGFVSEQSTAAHFSISYSLTGQTQKYKR